MLLAVALSRARLTQRWQFGKRRQGGNGPGYRYRLHDSLGADLGQITSSDVLEPGDVVRTIDGRAGRVVAVAPVETPDADYAALIEETRGTSA